MPAHIRISGAWKELNGLHIRIGGSWKQVNKAYIRISGAWKEFYAAISVIFTPTSHTLSVLDTSPVTCGIRFNRDGTIDKNDNGVYSQEGTWHNDAPSATLGDDYEVTATGGSGTWTSAAAADSTSIALTADRLWSVTQVGAGSNAASRDFEINLVARPADTATAACSCTATTI